MRSVTIAIVAWATVILAGPVLSLESVPEKQFVERATISSLFEIDASRLALDKSRNEDVRSFAQSMIDDHLEALEALKTAAGRDGVKAVPDGLDEKHEDILNRLEATSGQAFDQQYGQAQFQHHKEAVELFKSFAKEGHGGALHAFAVNRIPVLQEHYAAAGKLPD